MGDGVAGISSVYCVYDGDAAADGCFICESIESSVYVHVNIVCVYVFMCMYVISYLPHRWVGLQNTLDLTNICSNQSFVRRDDMFSSF